VRQRERVAVVREVDRLLRLRERHHRYAVQCRPCACVSHNQGQRQIGDQGNYEAADAIPARLHDPLESDVQLLKERAFPHSSIIRALKSMTCRRGN
jgi:hypothetical protein